MWLLTMLLLHTSFLFYFFVEKKIKGPLEGVFLLLLNDIWITLQTMLQQFLKYGMSIKMCFQKQGKRLLLKLVHLKKIIFNPKLNAINQKKMSTSKSCKQKSHSLVKFFYSAFFTVQ